MMIHFFTIVLDGFPWITHHLPIFQKLPPDIDWDWTVVEGVAEPVKDTSWCKPITPRLSQDGTHQYLWSLIGHPRFRFLWDTSWPGKTAMCNRALSLMKEPGLLWQVDADEIWDWQRITWMVGAFENVPSKTCADFHCRYFVGPNLVVDRIPGTWTNQYDWLWRRVWRFEPGMELVTHEPPVIGGLAVRRFSPNETNAMGIEFDHYAYVTEAQVAFKEQYYGYRGAVEGWRRLQENQQWPAKLREFLPWVTNDAMARPLYRE